MQATYIPTRNPEEASQEARKTFSQLTDLLIEVYSLPEDKKSEAIQQILAVDPNHLCEITKEISGTLTPEKLAACLARYSRSNEGIHQIVKENQNKTADGIFKMVDYGHASIGGLTGGIAIALDEVSMLLAYKFFEAAQMADGQESSTRYIQLDRGGLKHPHSVGIPENLRDFWEETCMEGFQIYKLIKEYLENEISEDPQTAKLPEKARRNPKIKERMLKNYALDRSRYYLPVACSTNIAIVATARVWADILKVTEALGWPEAIEATEMIRKELAKASPNLVRHSHGDRAAIAFQKQLQMAGQYQAALQVKTSTTTCECRLEVFDPFPKFQRFNLNLRDALETRENRYSHTGTAIKRMTVQTEWSAIALAELRDLNRHRTGCRFSNMAPVGFYTPEEIQHIYPGDQRKFAEKYERLVKTLAQQSGPGMQTYGYFLGTQVPFEHTQQADKFLYEVELRTGLGAHFRYAEHLKQAAELFFDLHPETREFITIGEAEPE